MEGSARGLLLDQSFRCIIYGYLVLVTSQLGYEQPPEFSIMPNSAYNNFQYIRFKRPDFKIDSKMLFYARTATR